MQLGKLSHLGGIHPVKLYGEKMEERLDLHSTLRISILVLLQDHHKEKNVLARFGGTPGLEYTWYQAVVTVAC